MDPAMDPSQWRLQRYRHHVPDRLDQQGEIRAGQKPQASYRRNGHAMEGKIAQLPYTRVLRDQGTGLPRDEKSPGRETMRPRHPGTVT